MPTERMSITRALTELKTLDDRIAKAIVSAPMIGVVKGDKETPTDRAYKTKGEMVQSIESGMQSINALMTRKSAIKRATILANATTMVKIGQKEMTIAEAIEAKREIPHKETLLRQMMNKLTSATMVVDREMASIDQQHERMVTNMGEKVTNAQELAETVRKTLLANHEPKLLDPLGLSDTIKKLGEEIDEIKLNVDFALSEINASTEIEVTY